MSYYIKAALVKELRARTGLGIIKCKDALLKSKGNIELAIYNLRKCGQVNALKKITKVASEGLILIKISKNRKYGVIIEINCETDFVTNESSFKLFCEEVILTAFNEKIKDINILNSIFKEKRINLINILCENIQIRRIGFLEGTFIYSYLHNARIGVIVSTSIPKKEEIIKKVAMHIAASKPEYVNTTDIPIKIISLEHKIQLNIAINSRKSVNFLEKMVEGRIRNFVNNITLKRQNFVMDPSKTIGEFLIEHNIIVNNFIYFNLGEFIKKS